MGGIIVAYGKGIGVRWCGGQLLGIPEELPERPACAAKTESVLDVVGLFEQPDLR